MWCIHTVVLTQPLLGRNPVLFCQISQTSIWSIAVHTFTRHILTSFSVNETLLPRYVNLSTSFRGPPYRVEIASSHWKHMYSVMVMFMWRPMLPATYLVCIRFKPYNIYIGFVYSDIPQNSSCTVTYQPSQRPSKLDEDMRDTAGGARMNS